MITKPTVLVLGAGASMAYGFPSGIELRDNILMELEGVNINILRGLGHAPHELENFKKAFTRSPVYSIDAFLERRLEFMDLGKSLNTNHLLPIEKSNNRKNRKAPAMILKSS